jgi:N6-L-threonylcarbamoyladenine synthase
MNKQAIKPIILGIESSCDDTSAAVIEGDRILSNVIASQKIHESYGGVVPELASRAHQQHIVPVIDEALKKANKSISDLDAIAFTQGPGLLGSLLVGTSFAKSLSLASQLPLIAVNHMEGHVLAHFIKENEEQATPSFPFLCLTVSGGHTQIVKISSPTKLEVIGSTIDDAAGEAFDKAAKMLGLPYPGGPLIDKYAADGNSTAFEFPMPNMEGLNYSFSGLKTSFLYFLKKQLKTNPNFIQENLNDLCASMQYTIVTVVLTKLIKASKQHNIKEIAIAGGVSANSYLRHQIKTLAKTHDWNYYIPKFEYCTDNAAMIAIAGKFKFQTQDFAEMNATPNPRLKIS